MTPLKLNFTHVQTVGPPQARFEETLSACQDTPMSFGVTNIDLCHCKVSLIIGRV